MAPSVAGHPMKSKENGSRAVCKVRNVVVRQRSCKLRMLKQRSRTARTFSEAVRHPLIVSSVL